MGVATAREGRAEGSAAESGERDPRRGRRSGLLLTAAVLLLGLLGTLVTVQVLRSQQRKNAERVMDQRAAMIHAAVRAEADRYRMLLETLAAGIATDEQLTWEDFQTASAPLGSADLIGAAAVAFVTPVRDTELASAQRLWRERGAEGLTLQPKGDSGEHFFTIFTRPLNEGGNSLAGVDLAAAAEPSQALDESRRIHRTTISDPYVLLRDRNRPARLQQQSLIFTAPIWTQENAPRFRGWVLLGLRGQSFLTGVLSRASQGDLDGRLVATHSDGTPIRLAAWSAAGDLDLYREKPVEVADQHWSIELRADADRLLGADGRLPAVVLGGGLAFNLVLAGLVYALATSRTRARAQVVVATAELRAAEAESRRQAGLLGAIMTSIGDGVGVVDEKGRFLLHNPAARDLLGVDWDATAPQEWQSHYGIFRPDGQTPFPLEEMPLIRALRGEATDGVEMLIRNERQQEGVLISVDGRPLDASAGQRGAVAVFRDITELRRYETDLQVFAGVVAHDLRAPLAVIRGHVELALADLSEPAGESSRIEPSRIRDVGAALGRVVRVVDRMDLMIETLLAYATARDAPLRMTDVDLGELVREVLDDQVAHRSDGPAPECAVGPLPAVRADPAMLRHVLDNLVGNALKYVAPGSTPRVEVSAGPDRPGWRRIEVADRGIGIPDADKPQVFDSFHRAVTAVGYSGTGLGLAICRRIVERHGGEIGVADNPGGGSRFFFTLPAAAAAVEPSQPVEQPTETQQTEDPVFDRDKPVERDEASARAALERALAEREAAMDFAFPAGAMLPPADPSANDPAGAPVRAPIVDRRAHK